MRLLRACIWGVIAPLLMMVPSLAHSQTLSAVWDPNPPSDGITSYEVCIGTSSLSCNFQLATLSANETSYTFAPNPGVLYRIAVRAINAAGAGPYSAEVMTSIPGLTQPANQTSPVNVAISPLSLSASDPDGGNIQFTHSGLPFGLSLNQSSGVITGTPTSQGTFNVTVFVSDGMVTTSRAFVWTVGTGSSGGGGGKRCDRSDPVDHEPQLGSEHQCLQHHAGRHGDGQRRGRQRHHECHGQWRGCDGRVCERQQHGQLEPQRRSGGRCEYVHRRRD